MRVLDAVGEQVEQDLVELRGVGPHRRQLGGQEGRDADALVLGARFDHRQDVEERGAQVDGLEVELELAGLDLRQVEDVVDQVEEGLAVGEDALDEPLLLLVELAGHAAEEHVAVADDRGERRAQLVTHGRHEVALELVEVGELAVLAGELLGVADVAHDHGDEVALRLQHAHGVVVGRLAALEQQADEPEPLALGLEGRDEEPVEALALDVLEQARPSRVVGAHAALGALGGELDEPVLAQPAHELDARAGDRLLLVLADARVADQGEAAGDPGGTGRLPDGLGHEVVQRVVTQEEAAALAEHVQLAGWRAASCRAGPACRSGRG